MAGSTSGISPGFPGLSRSSGQVTHVLLTRSRLCPRPKPGSSLHLHVLSTPPAFVLSQDQTLREVTALGRGQARFQRVVCVLTRGRRYTSWRPGTLDRNDVCLSTHPHARVRLEVGLGHTDESRVDSSGVLLSSFQRPSRPSGRGLLPAARARAALERADEYSARLRPRQETTWTTEDR